jgi:hypothetical protein
MEETMALVAVMPSAPSPSTSKMRPRRAVRLFLALTILSNFYISVFSSRSLCSPTRCIDWLTVGACARDLGHGFCLCICFKVDNGLDLERSTCQATARAVVFPLENLARLRLTVCKPSTAVVNTGMQQRQNTWSKAEGLPERNNVEPGPHENISTSLP